MDPVDKPFSQKIAITLLDHAEDLSSRQERLQKRQAGSNTFLGNAPKLPQLAALELPSPEMLSLYLRYLNDVFFL